MSKNRRRTVVYFPIEISAREYAGHVLLGTHLAARGMRVVIGHREVVNYVVGQSDKPGIVFFKGNAELRDLNAHYSAMPHLFVGQDPETGMVLPSFEEFYEARSVMQTLDSSSAYFCFGPDDYQYLKGAHPSAPLHYLGSPRVWLWGDAGKSFYADTIDSIRRRYARYILLVNSRIGSLDSVSLAAQVARETGCMVVIRPRPTENPGEYAHRVRTIAGVRVETAFDLNPWIRASEVTLAFGSTASFEAWFSNTPVLSDFGLAPDPNASTRRPLVSDLISLSPQNGESLPAAVASAGARWPSHRARPDLTDLVRQKVLRPEEVSVPGIADTIAALSMLESATTNPKRFDARREAYRFSKSSMLRSDEMRFRFRALEPQRPIKRTRITLRRTRDDVAWIANHFGLPPVSVRRLAPNCMVLE